MSFIRLLTLSYLAWALVFVVAATLMAHLPLPGDIQAQKAGKDVARVDMTPQAPVPRLQGPPAWARANVVPPRPRVVQEPKQGPSEPDQTLPDVVLPVLPLPPAPSHVARNAKQVATPAFRVPDRSQPHAPPAVASNAKPVAAPVSRIPDRSQPPASPSVASNAKPAAAPIVRIPNPPQPPAPPHVADNAKPATPPPFQIPDPPPYAIAILPDLPKPPVSHHVARTKRHGTTPAFRIPDPPPLDAPIFGHAEHAAAHLRAGLTPEMIRNFDLFLYVSKADAGPLSQRMYVFEKERSGELKLLYDWAASTGREQPEISPRGERTVTTTPVGYYELDPDRMYPSYHSYDWDQDMPDAMFFNWEREGSQSGLAIHAATGRDIEKLGERASAGCVHLAPENAAILFNLIRNRYRGPVPRFAYDQDSQTMSNQGKFMRDPAGKLKMADGYRVLIRIENYGGGGGMLAALF